MQGQLRVLCFADTHLGFDFPLRPRVEREHRGQGFFDNFRRILEYAERTKPDLVVHGGDLFFRSRVPPRIVDMVYEALMKFAASGIPIFIVPGNHERSRLPASLWLAAPNIHVFDIPRTFLVPVAGTTVAVSGFPFVREDVRSRFRSLLAETAWEQSSAPVKLLCMHQAVEGAQFGPANYTFRSGSDVVRMADIPQSFTAVLTGHIHRRQVLRTSFATGRIPVVYPGSIERTSFAEEGEPKGFFEITIAAAQTARWGVRQLTFLDLPTQPMASGWTTA